MKVMVQQEMEVSLISTFKLFETVKSSLSIVMPILFLRMNLLSTGKCKIIDLSEENAFRREKIEFLAWSAVDFMLDIADECIRQG